MKSGFCFSFFTSCFIGLFSASCHKDPGIVAEQRCDTCLVKFNPDSVLNWNTILLEDGYWVKQTDGSFVSDLKPLLQMSGSSAGEVYAIEITGENGNLQIMPNFQKFMGGSIRGIIRTADDLETCLIIFSYLEADRHSGQSPQGLPFQSLHLKITTVH